MPFVMVEEFQITKGVHLLTIIDCRNRSRIQRFEEEVVVLDSVRSGIQFRAEWDFPVPASLRRYFLNGWELFIEEMGRAPRSNQFLFGGIFIRK
jgi:hypothetical protein